MPAEAGFRPGEPGQEAAFQPVYERAGGIHKLGHALGPVQEHQLGWLQHFSGGCGGESAVLCALYGKSVVGVARAVWNDIEAIGNGVVGGGLVGAGFPVSGEPSRDGYVGSDAEIIDLAGGQWGQTKRGRLLRSPTSPAVWQPETAFDSHASRDRDTWPSLADQRDLRVRVAARIPLFADVWRISGSGRGRMLAAADGTGLATFFRGLAGRYSLEVPAGSWQETADPDGRNNSRFAAYQITANDTDGRIVFVLCLRLMLPDGLGLELHTTVDLRIDFGVRPGDGHYSPGDRPRRWYYRPVGLRYRLDTPAEYMTPPQSDSNADPTDPVSVGVWRVPGAAVPATAKPLTAAEHRQREQDLARRPTFTDVATARSSGASGR